MKLEFDTEDQVLFFIVFIFLYFFLFFKFFLFFYFFIFLFFYFRFWFLDFLFLYFFFIFYFLSNIPSSKIIEKWTKITFLSNISYTNKGQQVTGQDMEHLFESFIGFYLGPIHRS